MAVMVGVDIGGTFADFAAIDTGTGATTTLEVLTTPDAPGQDVAAGVRRLAEDGTELPAVQRFVHGATAGGMFTAPVVLASRAGIRYDVGDSGSSEMTSAMRARPQ